MRPMKRPFAPFLEGKISFAQIPEVVRTVMEEFTGKALPALEEIIAIDSGSPCQGQGLHGQRG